MKTFKSALKKIRKQCSGLWMAINGKAQHASNFDYDIRKHIYHQLLDDGRLDADKLLPSVDNKAQKKLRDAVCDIANMRRAGQRADASVVMEAESFIADNLPYMTTEFLDRMEQIATASGAIVLSHVIHKKNEELILQNAYNKELFAKRPVRVRNASKLFWSCLNAGGDDAVLKMLEYITAHYKADVAAQYRRLCSAFGLIAKDISIREQYPEHAAFDEYVRGKNIAIIGPSSGGADYSEEISGDFDTIIRTNYGGLGSIPEEQRSLAPQVSYYRSFHMRKFFADFSENIDYLKDLDFAVLRIRDGQVQERVTGYTNARHALHIPYPFFFGDSNMIPLILQDLSFFEPARIKVFYANLFLTKAIHDKGYITFTKGTLEHWRSNAKHNLTCQYEYMMHLYKRGLIEADARLSEILDLGTAEYIAQMEAQENQKPL